MNGSEVTVAGGPPANGRVLVKIGAPVQVGLSGPKTAKVTVPVGAGAGAGLPVTVAVSEIGLPTVTVGVAWVTMNAPSTTMLTSEVSSGIVARAEQWGVVGVAAVAATQR